MFVQDALRAQYFFSTLEDKLKEIRLVFKGDLLSFLKTLCHGLDQILLPTIAHEIREAKERGELIGKTKGERYQSFFIQNRQFTSIAKNLTKKYPFLFSHLDQTLSDAFTNLKTAINRLDQESQFPQANQIELISQSDKHQGQQTLLFKSEAGDRWIYKPRDLRPDSSFKRFIAHLQLKPPYDLKTASIFPRGSYGWIGFVPHTPCTTEQDIQNYYRRAGVLLAIADTLNYTDGHRENLIASGPYPILIDGETLFQNYSPKMLKQKTILSTRLIQKISLNNKQKSFHAAFQSQEKSVYHVLYPHPLNERTDDLQVELHGFLEDAFHNLPHINETFFVAQQFIEEVVDGFQYGYDAITNHAKAILEDRGWWEDLSLLQARALLRSTFNYVFLLRRIQQPDLCHDREKAAEFMRKKLGETPYTSYEIRDLLAGNIPYFYHHPHSPFCYNGEGEKVPMELDETSCDQIKRNLTSRSNQQKEASCKLIQTHLIRAKNELSPETHTNCEKVKSSG